MRNLKKYLDSIKLLQFLNGRHITSRPDNKGVIFRQFCSQSRHVYDDFHNLSLSIDMTLGDFFELNSTVIILGVASDRVNNEQTRF